MSVAEVKQRVHTGLRALGCVPPTPEHPDVGLIFPIGDVIVEELFSASTDEPVIKAFFDPTGGLPESPAVGDRFIATATANGWTVKNSYEWLGDVDGWSEITYRIGKIVYVASEDEWYGAGASGWRVMGEAIAVTGITPIGPNSRLREIPSGESESGLIEVWVEITNDGGSNWKIAGQLY